MHPKRVGLLLQASPTLGVWGVHLPAPAGLGSGGDRSFWDTSGQQGNIRDSSHSSPGTEPWLLLVFPPSLASLSVLVRASRAGVPNIWDLMPDDLRLS